MTANEKYSSIHEAVAMVIDNTFRLPKTDAKIFPSPGLFRTAEKGHQRL